jgi:murein DD-endopeptidase MepM/ murein hydrolase activator NlpD
MLFLVQNTSGKVDYYDEQGKTLKNFFLKSPIKFSRISSRFSSRFHPVQHRWKAHKGTDYATSRHSNNRYGRWVVEQSGLHSGNFCKSK